MKFLVVAILLFISGEAMATGPLFVGGGSNTGTTTAALSYTVTKTSNSLITCCQDNSVTEPDFTVADTLGNKFTSVHTIVGTAPATHMFITSQTISGADTITCTPTSGTGVTAGILVGEYSGMNAVDQTSTGTLTGVGGTMVSGPMTTFLPNEMAIACGAGAGASISPAGSFNSRENIAGAITGVLQDLVLTSTQVIISSMTTGSGTFVETAGTFLQLQAGPFGPTSCVDDASTGTVAWTTPTNGTDFNINLTTAALTASGTASEIDTFLELYVGGVFQTNQSTNAIWASVSSPVTFPLPLQTYGGSNNLMGASSLGGWQLQTTNFGLGLAGGEVTTSASQNSHDLLCTWKLTNAQLDSCATVTGLTFQYYKAGTTGVKCFPKGTKVWTPQGDISIEKLKIGHEVYSDVGGKLKISHVVKTRKESDYTMLDIVTEKGKITVSPEHRFFTPDGEKIIGKMKVGNYLFRRLGRDKILGIKTRHKKTMTYEVSLDNYHNYYANGFLVHNVTQRDLSLDYSSMTVTYTPGGSCQPSGGMPPSLMTLGVY